MRFLSERQLARGEFGNVKLLYVVGAKHISDEGLKGLERFVNAGGKIAVDSDSLTRNQYDNPVSRQFATEPVAPFKPDRLLEQIHRHVAPLPVSLAGDREGIFFRVVPEGNGNYLVNLVNYNFKPRRIQLEGKGSWFDLIGEQPFNPQLTLEPLKPQLLRFSPEK